MTAPSARGLPDPAHLPLYEPPPYVLPASPAERLAVGWREVTKTPVRAALGVVCAVAVVAAVIAASPVTVYSSDASGPYRARCGLGYYIGGYPTAGIAQTCHAAYSAHAAVFSLSVAAALVSVVSVVGLAVADRYAGADSRAASGSSTGSLSLPWVVRPVRWLRRQWSTPARAAVTTLAGLAVAVGALALRTVSVPLSDAHGPLVAHCGISYFVFGTSDAPVQQACRGHYGGHAAAFFLCLAAFIGSAVALRRLPEPAVEPMEVKGS